MYWRSFYKMYKTSGELYLRFDKAKKECKVFENRKLCSSVYFHYVIIIRKLYAVLELLEFMFCVCYEKSSNVTLSL